MIKLPAEVQNDLVWQDIVKQVNDELSSIRMQAEDNYAHLRKLLYSVEHQHDQSLAAKLHLIRRTI